MENEFRTYSHQMSTYHQVIAYLWNAQGLCLSLDNKEDSSIKYNGNFYLSDSLINNIRNETGYNVEMEASSYSNDTNIVKIMKLLEISVPSKKMKFKFN